MADSGAVMLDDAWRRYCAAVEESRSLLLSSDRCRDIDAHIRATYDIAMIQAVGFNFYVAPRRTHPNFYIHQVFSPFEVGWGQPCPDFLYRWAFVDGRGTYRVAGKRGTTPWAEIQVLNGFWGDEKLIHVTNVDLDRHTKPDGTFEIAFAADARAGVDWVAIPREARNVVLQSREAWCDWQHETGLQMEIEPIEPFLDEPWAFSAEELARRLDEAARWAHRNAKFNVDQMQRIVSGAGGTNRFLTESEGKTRGGLIGAIKSRMGYEVARDEALIIELNVPKCRYWSVSLADMWYQVTDYVFHQSSLNGCQAVLDADGRFRAVLAHEDPGVANWLDLVGCALGLLNTRILYPEEGFKADFQATKVKASEVRERLSNAKTVTPDARKGILARRAHAALARYGYRLR